jgi:hypothetical protein
VPEPALAGDPAPRPAIEATTEILEQLYSREPVLVGELLEALAGCDPQQLAKLFGSPSTSRRIMALRRSIRRLLKRLQVWAGLAVSAQRPHRDENPGAPIWDEHGKRGSPRLPSTFPRQPSSPQRGSHWST